MIQSKPNTTQEAVQRAVSYANGTSQRYARHHHLVQEMGLTKMLATMSQSETDIVSEIAWPHLTENGKAVFDACKREAIRQRRARARRSHG